MGWITLTDFLVQSLVANTDHGLKPGEVTEKVIIVHMNILHTNVCCLCSIQNGSQQQPTAADRVACTP